MSADGCGCGACWAAEICTAGDDISLIEHLDSLDEPSHHDEDDKWSQRWDGDKSKSLDRIGTIAPGKQADLVVIKGDPSKKIEDIENVEIVFKDGIGYDSAKLIEAARGVVGSR